MIDIDFRALPDLAVRNLGGSVVAANDEFFAQRENLITAAPPRFDPDEFGLKGKVYDGWETRRRREPGHDWALVRLGAPGVVDHVVVDTSWFRGNYPPEIAVEATAVDGHPSPDELEKAPWHEIVPRSACAGHTANVYPVTDTRRATHLRLIMHPDGGIARFRVLGRVLPDPRFLVGTVDLLAAENGGHVTGCSDEFYSSPGNLLLPGKARHMGEGWENARRRDGGNDWVEFALAAEGAVAVAELDTSWFLHNAPGRASLRGRAGEGEWVDLLPRTPLLPDTRHRFVLADAPPVDRVRVDVFPDGGMARLRLHGTPTDAGRAELERRWTAAR
jgi:allantoicase